MLVRINSPVGFEIYGLLCVPKFSDPATCKRAWKKQVHKFHPNRSVNLNEEERKKRAARTVSLNNAIEIMMDATLKEAYDNDLRVFTYRVFLHNAGKSFSSSSSSNNNSTGSSTPAPTAASSTVNTAAAAPEASSDKYTKAEERSERRTDVSASKVSSNKSTKANKPHKQRAVEPTKMSKKKQMLGRLVLLSGACASAAAAENVAVDLAKSIEKENPMGSSSSRRDVQADSEDPSSFTLLQRMKQEGVHQEDVPGHAPVVSHDVGVLSSKGDDVEEEEEDTLLSKEHRRRRAKMYSSRLPHDVDVSTNDGGYDKVVEEENVQYAKMEENRMIQLVNKRGDDEVAPVTKRNSATSSSSGVQGGSATATKTNQNINLGALDVNEYQEEYAGEDEDKVGVYYDEERVLVHQEEAYDPAAYDVTAAASYENRQLAGNTGISGSCPPGDVVTCVDGFATMVGGITTVGTPTCQDACDGGCCVGNGVSNGLSPNFDSGDPINSCTLFNGNVCKSGDIPSCSDNLTYFTPASLSGRACYRANIAEVVNGCNGRRACDVAGFGGAGIGRVANGCHGGDESCFAAASDGGYVKEIVDSCIGQGACISTGFIGYINHGCQGVKSCQFAAWGSSIGGISYACNNAYACEKLATSWYGFDSVNSAVVSCCNEASECTGSIVNQLGLPDQCGTSSPTSSPTTEPTGSPITESPSASPTGNPSKNPTTSPETASPTHTPSQSPETSSPSKSPSLSPTSDPTVSPSQSPETASPTHMPSQSPETLNPTTSSPSKSPSKSPETSNPSKSPSDSPSKSPTHTPSQSHAPSDSLAEDTPSAGSIENKIVTSTAASHQFESTQRECLTEDQWQAAANELCDGYSSSQCTAEVTGIKCFITENARRRLRIERDLQLEYLVTSSATLTATIITFCDVGCTSDQADELTKSVTDQVTTNTALVDTYLVTIACPSPPSSCTASTAIIKVDAPLSTDLRRYYPTWDNSGRNTCKNDGKYPLYMLKNRIIKSTLEACCATYYDWVKSECLVAGGKAEAESGKFYVDYVKRYCVQDCLEGGKSALSTCTNPGGTADTWQETYEDAKDCCKHKLYYLPQEECVAKSVNGPQATVVGTLKWYVASDGSDCVQDCATNTGSACVPTKGTWGTKYADAKSCCKAHFSWLKEDMSVCKTARSYE